MMRTLALNIVELKDYFLISIVSPKIFKFFQTKVFIYSQGHIEFQATVSFLLRKEYDLKEMLAIWMT